ncbi:MAG: small basic family protein [Actinomycetota bacterium]|nr:small basic family protein [Actinomycetota bacterium]
MIWFLALILGAAAGLVLQPTVPVGLQPFLSVAVIAALDAVFGAVRAWLDGTFIERVFLVSFFTNVLLAVFLVYLGNSLGVGADLTTAVVVVFGVRMFQNLAAVRRHLFQA